MAEVKELVTVKTIKDYRDAEKKCIFEVGDEHEVTKEKAEKLVKAKVAEIVKKPAKENNTEK